MGVYQDKYQSVNKSFPLEVGKGDGQEGTFYTLNTALYFYYFQWDNTTFTFLKKNWMGPGSICGFLILIAVTFDKGVMS